MINCDLCGEIVYIAERLEQFEQIKNNKKKINLFFSKIYFLRAQYQYDAFHRRFKKNHGGRELRYLYQGQNEIGSVNAIGEITELRILGIGVEAEIGAAVAIELQGEIFAPIHDRQGNVACLVDYATSFVKENYRYTAFGEEILYGEQGQQLEDSQVGNPWRFAGKRKDSETGWIYFGRRYYDPEIGRWTTPDPASFADGSNLYAYVHHNPMNTYDAYSLYGEAYRDSAEAGPFQKDREKGLDHLFGHRFGRLRTAICRGSLLGNS